MYIIICITIEARKSEHDDPTAPNFKRQENQNQSHLHVPTFGVYCNLAQAILGRLIVVKDSSSLQPGL